ncbi:hypothetical protein B0J11DRAFT_452280 [Dendryphion nanum]|uniref:Uncharacterized protein n=1 Tax=Dendryphion nanum TaxID=256645 RepID=A0A9P9EKJ9_9PLEO|nr:hypothetical protein B0J11DRAFT_452280 [Dendryphion nanum]
MLPPRRISPPRICQFPWKAVQVRQASGVLRHAQVDHHRVDNARSNSPHADAGNAPTPGIVEPSVIRQQQETPPTDENSNPQPTRVGWLSSPWAGVSKLFKETTPVRPVHPTEPIVYDNLPQQIQTPTVRPSINPPTDEDAYASERLNTVAEKDEGLHETLPTNTMATEANQTARFEEDPNYPTHITGNGKAAEFVKMQEENRNSSIGNIKTRTTAIGSQKRPENHRPERLEDIKHDKPIGPGNGVQERRYRHDDVEKTQMMEQINSLLEEVKELREKLKDKPKISPQTELSKTHMSAPPVPAVVNIQPEQLVEKSMQLTNEVAIFMNHIQKEIRGFPSLKQGLRRNVPRWVARNDFSGLTPKHLEAQSAHMSKSTQDKTATKTSRKDNPTRELSGKPEAQPNFLYNSSKNLFKLVGSEAASQEEKEWLEWRRKKRVPGGKNTHGLQTGRIGITEQEPSSVIPPDKDSVQGFVEASLQNRIIAAIESPILGSQRLVRQIHSHATDVQSSNSHVSTQGECDESTLSKATAHSKSSSTEEKTRPSSKPIASDEMSEQSLLEELFPEVSYAERKTYPKLELPKDTPLIRRETWTPTKNSRERVLEGLKQRNEEVTVLQLLNCSTELTESDFRRLVPKGRHISSWIRDGEFVKVIPGRDPLTLERMPFYYLLFRTAEAASAYQNNASRLHKLSGLHQPTNILSAVTLPRGFLEDGEDITTATSSYVLMPSSTKLRLNMLMQPYNPALRNLFQAGGYNPIVPPVDPISGKPIWKVLLHIEGWEPSPEDLFHIFTRHAYDRGLTWPFTHIGANKSIRRLRDVINLQSKLQAVSSSNPRAANPDRHRQNRIGPDTEEPLPDPSFDFLSAELSAAGNADDSDGSKTGLSQMVMSRVYNRWIVEFEEEGAARRFARIWHRRVLPLPKLVTWRDTEEVRMVNAEFLW